MLRQSLHGMLCVPTLRADFTFHCEGEPRRLGSPSQWKVKSACRLCVPNCWPLDNRIIGLFFPKFPFTQHLLTVVLASFHIYNPKVSGRIDLSSRLQERLDPLRGGTRNLPTLGLEPPTGELKWLKSALFYVILPNFSSYKNPTFALMAGGAICFQHRGCNPL